MSILVRQFPAEFSVEGEEDWLMKSLSLSDGLPHGVLRQLKTAGIGGWEYGLSFQGKPMTRLASDPEIQVRCK